MSNRFLSLSDFKTTSPIVVRGLAYHTAWSTDEMLDACLSESEMWIDSHGDLEATGDNYTRDMTIIARKMAEVAYIKTLPQNENSEYLPIIQESLGDSSATYDRKNPISNAEAFCERTLAKYVPDATQIGGSYTDVGLAGAMLTDSVTQTTTSI